MTKYKIIVWAFLTTTIFISCDKTKTVVLSKFLDGKPKETIELTKPITEDSIGLMKVFFENGSLHAFGESKNRKRQGEWISYFPNGKPEWKSVFKDDIENGETICYDTSGYWRKFNVKNGFKEGRYTSYFYDWFDSVNCYVNGYYVNGIEQGLWTKTDTSGILLVEMTYINGKAKGYFTNRYKNGKLKLQGELDSNGSMRNFKFYDEYGDVKKKKEYLLRKI
jgi:antitoxin component YwqK of YwqJK toxin-antitoxin module